MSGELIEINGCVRVKDSDSNDGYALVWPPDFKMTIEDDQIKVVSGLVSGQHLERVIKIGELVKLGGGIVGNPDEQLRGTIPSDCIGPYWVVGSNFLPLSPTPTPK
ncbi:MAG: hypothetical protein A2Z16_01340 [Chloroflexi bacterium RBG_16_54_18]|nr:MAG: hypothetical protein A2Z16_01340 [Chloroflexi bacterium RBG_16_54_18]